MGTRALKREDTRTTNRERKSKDGRRGEREGNAEDFHFFVTPQEMSEGVFLFMSRSFRLQHRNLLYHLLASLRHTECAGPSRSQVERRASRNFHTSSVQSDLFAYRGPCDLKFA